LDFPLLVVTKYTATTLKETGDMIVVFGDVLSLILSGMMFLQYWLYLENTKKQMAGSSTAKGESAKKED